MIGYLVRQYYPTHTYGTLYIEGAVFHTLERPWLNNKSNVSCIPPAIYEASFLLRSASGKYKQVWHLKPTQPRTGILMHNGNLVRHTKGCPLLGLRKGSLGGQPAVLGSKSAMRKLRKLTNCKGFTLHIIGNK
jgi:hypothetical protein